MIIMDALSANKIFSKSIIALFFLNAFLLAYIVLIKTNLLGSDSTAYIQGANSLLKYNVFSSMGEVGIPDNFRTVGYPAIIAFAMTISSEYYVNIVIALQVILLYAMFVRFIGVGVVFDLKMNQYAIALAPFMFHPELLNLATSLQTEFLYVFTIFFFFLFSIKYFKGGNVNDLILSAIFIAFSLHIKPVYLFFAFIYLFLIFLLDKNIKNMAVAVLIMLVILGPWVLRNKITLDTYSFTSSKNFNLLCYAYSLTKAKYNLMDAEAVERVDNVILDKYGFNKEASVLELVSSQNNELIDRVIPVEAKKIIFSEIKYLPEAYLKGVLRGFYLPHTIYNVEAHSPIHIESFVDKVKRKDVKLIFISDSGINYSAVYFYVFPYILNVLAIIGVLVFSFLWFFKKDFRSFQTSFILLFVWYGLSVAFPWSNNSRYMMAYYPQMAIMLFYSFDYLYRKENR